MTTNEGNSNTLESLRNKPSEDDPCHQSNQGQEITERLEDNDSSEEKEGNESLGGMLPKSEDNSVSAEREGLPLPKVQSCQGKGEFPIPDYQLFIARIIKNGQVHQIPQHRLHVRFKINGEVNGQRLNNAVVRAKADLDICALNVDLDREMFVPVPPEQGDCQVSLAETDGSFVVDISGSHLCLDFLMITMILARIAAYYNNERPKPVTAIRDFASWYEHIRSFPVYRQAREFWSNRRDENVRPIFHCRTPKDPSDWALSETSTLIGLPDNLSQFCKTLSCTRFELFLTLFNKLLAELSPESRIPCGMVMNLRTLRQLACTTGCMTNRIYHTFENFRQKSLAEAVCVVQESLAMAKKNLIFPAWKVMDPETNEYPHVFFNYIPFLEKRTICFGSAEAILLPSAEPERVIFQPFVFSILDEGNRMLLTSRLRSILQETEQATSLGKRFADLIQRVCQD